MGGATNCCIVSGNVIVHSTYYALEGRNGNFVFSNNVIIGGQYAVTSVGKATNANILMVGNLISRLTTAPYLLQEANGHTATVVFEK